MITVRAADAGDIPALVTLWNEGAGPTSLPCGPDEITRLLQRDADATLVAVDEGPVVGSLIVGWDGWRCHMYRMAVSAAARRRGIATALLSAAADRADRVGAVRFDATVHPDNPDGIAFWAAVGFEQDVYGRWTRAVHAWQG